MERARRRGRRRRLVVVAERSSGWGEGRWWRGDGESRRGALGERYETSKQNGAEAGYIPWSDVRRFGPLVRHQIWVQTQD